MSQGNGRAKLAIGGLIALWLALYPAGYAQESQRAGNASPYENEDSQNEPDNRAEKVELFQPTIFPPTAFIQPIAPNEEKTDSASQANWDLGAQWTMAITAILQAVLSGIGIWLIWRTLLATQDAVREASAATVAANKGALAALKANRQFGKSSRLELRAYVVLQDFRLQEGYWCKQHGRFLGAMYQIELDNVGVTPATVRDAFINIREVPSGSPLPDGNVTTYPIQRHTIELGAGRPQCFGKATIERNSLEQGKDVYLFAVVRYVDIFHDNHEIVRAIKVSCRRPVSELDGLSRQDRQAALKEIMTWQTVSNYGHST